MPTVRFTQNLQRHLPCPTCQVGGSTVAQVLEGYFQRYERARGYVLDDQGRLRQHMAVFIDGNQVQDRERLSDPVDFSATLDIIQSLSGGNE